MDFFDPQKQKRHAIRLSIGYALMGIMLVMATTILLYYSYGFGIDKEGRVIQNGLTFVSSQPRDAEVFVNDKKYKDTTNTRMNLPSGQYVVRVKRDGYHEWKRDITVRGGSVERLDYSLLFPKKPKTSIIKQYDAAPGLSTQSPDHRWLLVAVPNHNEFDLYDTNAKAPLSRTLAIPSDILAAGSTSKAWELVEWSKDNRHVVVKRLYDASGQAGSEYILFDRESPELSQNLTVALGFNPTTMELRDKVHDRYYLFDQVSAQVFTASLEEPTPKPYLTGILAFTSEKDVISFVTTNDADVGKVVIRMKQNNDPSLEVRQIPVGGPYLLDMGVYDDAFYLAAGASADNRIFLFKDPIAKLHRAPHEPLVPVQILKVAAPNHLAFSPDKRFVIAESGDKFAVYDTETDRSYAYQVPVVLDAPQTRAQWMDEFRLGFVSGGKALVFDFDGTNLQHLSDASPNYLPVFAENYRSMFTINGQNGLTSTSLLTAKDL